MSITYNLTKAYHKYFNTRVYQNHLVIKIIRTETDFKKVINSALIKDNPAALNLVRALLLTLLIPKNRDEAVAVLNSVKRYHNRLSLVKTRVVPGNDFTSAVATETHYMLEDAKEHLKKYIAKQNKKIYLG
jgi:hypothetical protein